MGTRRRRFYRTIDELPLEERRARIADLLALGALRAARKRCSERADETQLVCLEGCGEPTPRGRLAAMPVNLTDFTSDVLESTDRWPEIKATVDSGSPLEEVAERFGVSSGGIRGALRRTGARGQSRIVRRLAGAPPEGDRGVADEPNAGRRRSRRTPRTDEVLEGFRDQLGQVPDTEIAEMAGVSMWVVRGYRIRQGVDAYRRRGGRHGKKASAKVRRKASRERRTDAATGEGAKSKGKPTPGLMRVARHHDLVGTLPDHKVADKAGVSVGTVRSYRKKHGIPAAPRTAWASSRANKRPSPSATTQSPRSHGAGPLAAKGRTPQFAWRVVFDGGEERIAVEATLALAAERAEGAGLGEVVRLERLGAALVG